MPTPARRRRRSALLAAMAVVPALLAAPFITAPARAAPQECASQYTLTQEQVPGLGRHKTQVYAAVKAFEPALRRAGAWPSGASVVCGQPLGDAVPQLALSIAMFHTRDLRTRTADYPVGDGKSTPNSPTWDSTWGIYKLNWWMTQQVAEQALSVYAARFGATVATPASAYTWQSPIATNVRAVTDVKITFSRPRGRTVPGDGLTLAALLDKRIDFATVVLVTAMSRYSLGAPQAHQPGNFWAGMACGWRGLNGGANDNQGKPLPARKITVWDDKAGRYTTVNDVIGCYTAYRTPQYPHVNTLDPVPWAQISRFYQAVGGDLFVRGQAQHPEVFRRDGNGMDDSRLAH